MPTPTLIVETGLGVTGANTYISDNDALTYFVNRGDSVWPETDMATRDAALVRACFGLGYWLNGRWYGRKATSTQPLDWPRCGVRDSDGYLIANNVVPPKVQYAQCEIAKIELTTPFIQQSVTNLNSVQSERVGPIEVEFKNTAPSITYWPMVIAMLRDYATIGIMPIEVVIGISADERRQMERERTGGIYGPQLNPADLIMFEKQQIYNPSDWFWGNGWYDADYLI